MANLARLIAIIRDLVWTAIGVLVLVGMLFLATGGASHLLPAGLGGSNNPQASGGNNGSGPAAPGAGAQQPGPGGQQPGSGAQQPGGSLAISASGDFGGQFSGQQVSGNFKVDAVQGSGGTVNFSLNSTGGPLSFTGQVACLARLGADSGRAVVGGNIRQSNNPAKMPPGSGFVLGLASGNPGQISFEAGFPLSGDPSAVCNQEAPNLFGPNHPGLPLTSGSINIQ